MDTPAMISRIQNAFWVAPEERNVGTRERVISSVAGLLIGINALRNFRRGGFSLLLPAGFLLWRGATGYCPVNNWIGRNTAESPKSFELTKSVRISRDRSEVYNYWRGLENLPMIMKHINRVEKISDNQYHWEATFNNQKFNWNAEILEDLPNQRISWRSLQPSDVDNSGSVEFNEVPEGTEVKVTMIYRPAESEGGYLIASVLNPLFKQIVKQDLNDFKRNVESGDIILNKSYVSIH
jgi:uncharacterized membrane protein